MGIATLVSVEEYLRTSWHPDREYVDGVVVERNGGELPHSWLQTEFWSRFRAAGLFAFVELRTQVKAMRFRVPDVLATRERPRGGIVRTPPYVVVEILSPEDRYSDLIDRINDYLDFGVPNIWIVDPLKEAVSAWTREGSHRFASAIETSDGAISIPLDEVFAGLREFEDE